MAELSRYAAFQGSILPDPEADFRIHNEGLADEARKRAAATPVGQAALSQGWIPVEGLDGRTILFW